MRKILTILVISVISLCAIGTVSFVSATECRKDTNNPFITQSVNNQSKPSTSATAWPTRQKRIIPIIKPRSTSLPIISSKTDHNQLEKMDALQIAEHQRKMITKIDGDNRPCNMYDLATIDYLRAIYYQNEQIVQQHDQMIKQNEEVIGLLKKFFFQ
ncbi:MAG: hypothetical protein PHE59_03700 [Patescibacteria group bacterium]|nr:hypothetical protein [Patescibacteria group bacterium]MDD5164759.1 hypothetical protein [Patescibacteria group bacterium]MDD5534425.1 hypothetical protein [Patescibacteria group bacterium]